MSGSARIRTGFSCGVEGLADRDDLVVPHSRARQLRGVVADPDERQPSRGRSPGTVFPVPARRSLSSAVLSKDETLRLVSSKLPRMRQTVTEGDKQA